MLAETLPAGHPEVGEEGYESGEGDLVGDETGARRVVALFDGHGLSRLGFGGRVLVPALVLAPPVEAAFFGRACRERG